ncbi:MAG: flagellar filament capping protein FliD [Porticoccaceae bacterium]|nr:flagellar filament capping protein FliD [Porticoccaceae bacterium]
MVDSTSSSDSGATAASTILTTLGAGSGIDIFKMSRDLTDVEKLPKQEKINEKIEASTAQVSAYGLVKYQLEVLKLSFEGLNDANEMATNNASSTNTTAVNFSSLDGTAQVGSYDVTVSSLANGQQSKSTEYSSATQQLNSGSAFNITLGVGPTGGTQANTTIAVATDTPQGVVNAINAGDYGVTATLVDTGTAGTNQRIILSGSSGTAKAYTITSTPDLGFGYAGASAKYTMPFVNGDASGASSDQNLTFSFGGKTATVDLYNEDSGTNAARYSGLSDANLLAAINSQLDAQGIGFTASVSSDGSGFTFTQDAAGAVTSAPTATVDGSAVSLTQAVAGAASNTMQSATDAVIGFNGLTITRSSNTINDVVAGAVLSINQVTETGGTSNPARLTISSDTSTLKTKVQSLVSEYNNFNGLMSELGSSATDDDNDMMGALRRDTATVRYVQNALRTAVLANSSTTSGGVEGLRDIGVSMDKSGNLTFDEKKYDTAITTSYDKVVTMLTADTTNQSEYSTAAKGLAQDIAKVLDGLGDTSSVLSTRNTTAENSIETYEEELADLEKRMEAVYDRYLSQFAAMEGMMNSMNGTRDYLEGQLESLSKAYDS